ncbi:MAG TPA: hypothetical protein VGQ10_01835 [Vicinamibacterales bacterium]|nr:hypothetical protein [Vicinamibacterales bacterium]
MRSARAWAVLFVLANINTSAAQEQEAPSIFLDGAGFVSFERTAQLRYQTPVVTPLLTGRYETPVMTPLLTGRDASGNVAGGGFAIGTFLGPRVSVRLEAAFPASLTSSYATRSGIIYSSPFGRIPEVIPSRVEDQFRQRSAAVLLGYHTGRRHRVRLGFLAGVAIRWEQQRSRTEQTVPAFVPVVPLIIQRSDVTATTYRPAPAVGIDADIAMVRHVSLVPQMRVQAIAGLLSLRPGIAVRWIP